MPGQAGSTLPRRAAGAGRGKVLPRKVWVVLGIGAPELLILLAVLVVLVGVVVAVGLLARGRTPAPPRPLPEVPLPVELQSRLRTLSAQGQKIQAIKELREATGLSLLDAKNTVDAIAAGGTRPVPAAPPRADLAYRARSLAAAGRQDEAVRLVGAETGMSAPEATAFLRSLLGPDGT